MHYLTREGKSHRQRASAGRPVRDTINFDNITADDMRRFFGKHDIGVPQSRNPMRKPKVKAKPDSTPTQKLLKFEDTTETKGDRLQRIAREHLKLLVKGKKNSEAAKKLRATYRQHEMYYLTQAGLEFLNEQKGKKRRKKGSPKPGTKKAAQSFQTKRAASREHFRTLRGGAPTSRLNVADAALRAEGATDVKGEPLDIIGNLAHRGTAEATRKANIKEPEDVCVGAMCKAVKDEHGVVPLKDTSAEREAGEGLRTGAQTRSDRSITGQAVRQRRADRPDPKERGAGN